MSTDTWFTILSIAVEKPGLLFIASKINSTIGPDPPLSQPPSAVVLTLVLIPRLATLPIVISHSCVSSVVCECCDEEREQFRFKSQSSSPFMLKQRAV